MNLKRLSVTVLFFIFLCFMLTSLAPLSAQDACGNCGEMAGSIQKCDSRPAEVHGDASGNCISVQGFVVQEQNGAVTLYCTYTQFYNCPQAGAQADGCPLDQGAIFSGCGGI